MIKDPDELVTNEDILEMTPEKIDSIVVCAKHPNRKIEYYCSHDDIYMCLKCMIDHLDHKEMI
jgi:hypothetical protein